MLGLGAHEEWNQSVIHKKDVRGALPLKSTVSAVFARRASGVRALRAGAPSMSSDPSAWRSSMQSTIAKRLDQWSHCTGNIANSTTIASSQRVGVGAAARPVPQARGAVRHGGARRASCVRESVSGRGGWADLSAIAGVSYFIPKLRRFVVK